MRAQIAMRLPTVEDVLPHAPAAGCLPEICDTGWRSNWWHVREWREMRNQRPTGGRRYKGRGPGGRPLCNWCGVEVGPRKRNWCSQECADRYLEQTDYKHNKDKVFERDGGRCRLCGFDMGLEDERVRYWRSRFAPMYGGPGGYDRHVLAQTRERLGFRRLGDWHDTDHIVPQIFGGGHHPDNLRTLCTPCHKAETSKLAGFRAAIRRHGYFVVEP